MRWQNSFTRLVGIAFGTMTLFMSAMVSVEIFSRKIFGFSMQGADEISGYIMAVMSCLAAAVAVVGPTTFESTSCMDSSARRSAAY